MRPTVKTLKFTCKSCGQRISAHDTDAGTSSNCPSCGASIVIPEPNSASVLPPAPERLPADVPAQFSPQEHLANLRAHSCYRVFRGVVDFIFALSVVGVLFYVVARFRESSEPGITAVALSLAGIFFVALAFAARQAAVLLIDIADSLLRRNSKDAAD